MGMRLPNIHDGPPRVKRYVKRYECDANSNYKGHAVCPTAPKAPTYHEILPTTTKRGRLLCRLYQANTYTKAADLFRNIRPQLQACGTPLISFYDLRCSAGRGFFRGLPRGRRGGASGDVVGIGGVVGVSCCLNR